MKSMNRFPVCVSATIVILTFILVVAGGAIAGLADNVINTAIRLDEEGKWPEAVAMLRSVLMDPGTQEQGPIVSGRLKYTLGYVLERQAAADIENREKLYADSAAVYRAALRDIPNHGPTLHALAMLLVREGKSQQALKFLSRAIEYDKGRAGYYLLASGEIHQQEKRWAEALADFQEAAGLLPDQAAPRRQMVDTLEELPFEQLEQMLEVIGTWEESFPDVARKAYEAIIRGACESRGPLADRTMMSWATMMADNDWISSGSLSFLSSGCMDAARAGMLAYLAAPIERPAQSNWWMSGLDRKLILTRVAWALGNRELSSSRPETAEKIWALANSFCELPSNQLVADLAVLYSNHRAALDPTGSKRKRLLSRTYQGKSQAYRKGDMESIERYHTILAIIFSSEEKWGNSHNSMTAIFQLEHALKTAQRRDQKIGSYRPQAGLKKRLADGLKATNRADEAREMYLDATMAYLDIDDLRSAEKMLAEGWSGATAETKNKAVQLRSLMGYRQTLAAGQLDDAVVEDLYRRNQEQLLGTDPDGGLDPGFLQRQQFKVLADIADQSTDETSLDCASRAFNLAATGQTTLTGVRDLMRLEKVRDEVTSSVGVVGDWQITNQNLAAQAPAGRVKLSLPGTGQTKVVGLSPITVKAGQIRELVGPERDLTLQVADGKVNVLHDYEPDVAEPMIDRIRMLEGVNFVEPKEVGPKAPPK
jgi:tetratricopeptide (TPR) repeat protein